MSTLVNLLVVLVICAGIVLFAARKKDSMSQSVLKFNSDGKLHLWEYSESVARTELCRLIAGEDLPLGFGESHAFEEYIKRAHNPRFAKSSRQTSTRDMVKHFTERRGKLKDSLLSSVTSICLTSDIWSGNAKEDYLSVVAHFVNADWDLEKRLLALRLIDVSHSGANIAERVSMVVDEYGISDKIFAVTLDNASSNSTAMDILTPAFSGYILAALPPNATEEEVREERSLFMHQRCACHIINLIVKSGMKRLKPYIEDFRTAISFLNSSNQRIAAYKSYCMSMGVRPRKFGLDMDVRWNSTYLMLKHVVPYKSTFSVFIKTQHPLRDGLPLLTDNHWYVADKVLAFLELFYDSTVALSGVYYPTSSLMLHHILDIAKHLNAYENDELLRNVVVPMKDKFLKYWRKIPLLYAFAFILDPRAKMKGFHNALRLLSTYTGTDYSMFPTDVRGKLTKIFERYETKFGDVRLHRPQQSASANTGKKKMAWGLIFGASDVSSSSSSSVGSPPPSQLGRRASTGAVFPSVSSLSELSSYLDSDCVVQYDEDFNILNWWHEHKQTYPILSILARDVLTVPASTISSESTFSLAGRVIEERRRRLTSDMVEVLSCLKDWELADAQLQHNIEKETKDLELAFENMYLDDDAAAAQG
jgi:hypothetical protein